MLSAGAGMVPAADATLAVARFSALTAGLVTVLALAGVVLGRRVVGSWSALFGTNYGVTLLVKAAIVAVALAVAARNRYHLLPRIRAQAEPASAWTSLRRAVRLEAVLLAAVVATTGILVSLSPVEAAADPPAAQPQAGPSPVSSATERRPPA